MYLSGKSWDGRGAALHATDTSASGLRRVLAIQVHHSNDDVADQQHGTLQPRAATSRHTSTRVHHKFKAAATGYQAPEAVRKTRDEREGNAGQMIAPHKKFELGKSKQSQS